MDRGSIIKEAAYAQGKMLDHSRWNMPRQISLSDIDHVQPTALDNRGEILLMEFSKTASRWEDIKTGQRKMYSNLCRVGRGKIFAVLASHCVPEDRQIDTRNDILSFSAMCAHAEYSTVWGNDRWIEFVESTFRLGFSTWINRNLAATEIASNQLSLGLGG